MKRKFTLHLITVLLIIVMLSFGLASANRPSSRKGDAVEVTWDEGLTSGVTRITNDGNFKNWARVSPDGTKLLYTEASKAGYWTICFLRDANNPSKTPLIGEVAYSPSWYEDSNRFLYVSFEAGSGRLVRSNISGGGKTYISRSAIGAQGDDAPVIKDGLIVFSAFSGQRWEIVTIRESGTETTFLGEGRSPSWHPSLDKIIFIRNPDNPRSSGGDIFEMDMNSGQVTQIYSDPNFWCYTPSYSPDGRRVLFTKGTTVRRTGTASSKNIFGGTTRTAVSTESIQTHIFVMNVDGTNVSPVSSGNASVMSPSWGNNGEVFCLVGLAGKAYEIYKLRIRGE